MSFAERQRRRRARYRKSGEKVGKAVKDFKASGKDLGEYAAGKIKGRMKKLGKMFGD